MLFLPGAWGLSQLQAEVVYDVVPLDPKIFGNYDGSEGWGINNEQIVIGQIWQLIETEPVPIRSIPLAAIWDFSQLNSNGISHTLQTAMPSMNLIYPHLNALNDKALACGYYDFDNPNATEIKNRPLLYNYRSRTYEDLGCLGDDTKEDPFSDDYKESYAGAAEDINNSGLIIGGSALGVTNMWGLMESYLPKGATRWRGPGEPEYVTENYGHLNNNGMMVGAVLDYPRGLYTLSGGVSSIISMPQDYPPDEFWYAMPYDLNDNGWIVGCLGNGPLNINKPALWHPTLGFIPLPVYPGTESAIAKAVNNLGAIVGTSDKGAVIWLGSGTDYQIVSLDMFAAQTGWTLLDALDINDVGNIVGNGKFNGREMGFLARARFDENPPAAILNSAGASWVKGRCQFSILYYDDNGIATNTVDSQDIEMRMPDNATVPARCDSIKELAPETGTGKRRYEALYSTPMSGINPFNALGMSLAVSMKEAQVSDLSGRFVTAGKLGAIQISQPAATVSILSGTTAKGSSNLWTFETRLFLDQTDVRNPVQSARFLPPGAAEWIPLATTDRESWGYSLMAAAPVSTLQAGDYRYEIVIEDGGPKTFSMAFRYGIDTNGVAVLKPATMPVIESPANGATLADLTAGVRWKAVSDPAVSKILCVIQDLKSGTDVYSKAFDTNSTGTGPIHLPEPGDYRSTLNFCAGHSNFSETNNWISYKLFYTAATADFKIEIGSPSPTILIQTVKVISNSVELVFANAQAGSWTVETTPQLKAGNWVPVSEAQLISASNGIYSVRCPLGSSPHQYYRVKSGQ